MSEIDDCFEGSNGADASDLLRYIFSSLISDDLNIKNNNGNNNENNNELPLDESNENEVFNEIRKEISPSSINSIFYIYYKISYLCTKKHTTYNFEYSSFLDFNLFNIAKEIRNDKKNYENITLDECFKYNNNIKDNYEDFECSICQDSLLKSKSSIYMTNDYLIIFFNYGKNKNCRINVLFEEYINIEEFIEIKNNEYFELIGTIVHYGSSSSSGHYISYCRREEDNKFYKFNDEIVTESSYEELIKEKTTYILFYQKYKKYEIAI